MNNTIKNWFKKKNWQIFEFQEKVATAYANNKSGMIYSATGTGKTYAIWLAILESFLNTDNITKAGIKILWLTPMRALAKDTAVNLQKPLEDLNVFWKIGIRTSDTPSSERTKQNKKLPEVLITTPESLSVLLSQKKSPDLFTTLTTVVVDEWHELLGNKRGVQTQLVLARLRNWLPNLKIWGLTATLSNITDACYQLIGHSKGCIIEGMQKPPPKLTMILPETLESFPWAGHMGLKHLNLLLPYLEAKQSTLIFLNTRSQAESWYQSILEIKPDWAGLIAIHHSAIDKKVRTWVEQALRDGLLKVVICTSSLDLGVDFSPVEQVVQVGSPKGVARLLQRAGRSQHQPDGQSELLLFPTHAFEILEYKAASMAIAQNRIESRLALNKPYDVLIQHLITIAIGTGFVAESMLEEVRLAPCYQSLTEEEWQSVLEFIQHGGTALTAYPEYQKVVVENGHYQVTNQTIARRHRMTIGTITSDAMINVKFQRGKKIATVEESFISKLKAGDVFTLAGRSLEFLRLHNMEAIVKLSKKTAKIIPRWLGGRLPLTSLLNHELQCLIETLKTSDTTLPELSSLLHKQRAASTLPAANELLIETTVTKEGHHCFIFPFAGRALNEILALLMAQRLSLKQPNSFSIAVNDYGFDLCASKHVDLSKSVIQALLTEKNILEDLLASTNITQLHERQFRDIARIAGLVFSGYPGSQKSVRQIQASSTLLYQVLKKYDPNNILLQQAHREVLSEAFKLETLTELLHNLRKRTLVLIKTERLTPFAFPLWVELQRLTLSSEDLHTRILRMLGKIDET